MDSYRFSQDTNTIIIRAELKGRPYFRKSTYEDVKNGQGDNFELQSEPFEVKSTSSVATPARAGDVKKNSNIKTTDKYEDQVHIKSITSERQVTLCEESKTPTKLNPDAKEFVSKSIEWDKLPLKPKESPVLESMEFEASMLNIDNRLAGFESNDARFAVPRLAPLPLPDPALISTGMSSSYAYPRERNDSFGFRDTYITDSKSVDKSDRLRQKNEFPGKQCYHCGNFGHMAADCSRKKLGFGAVCFTCQETGHIKSECPNDPKNQQEPDESLQIQIHKPKLTDHKSYPTTPVQLPKPKYNQTRSCNHAKKLVEKKRHKSGRARDVSKLLYPPGLKVTEGNNQVFFSESPTSRLKYPSDCSNNSSWTNNINDNNNYTESRYVLEDQQIDKFPKATHSGLQAKEIDEKKPIETATAKDDQTIPLPEALANILLSNFTMEIIKVRVDKTLNHYLARDVHVQLNSPRYNTAEIDGWAVNESKKVKSYKWIGIISPGSDPASIKFASSARKTIYVEAGSPIPEGFNCIVPDELVAKNGNVVTLNRTNDLVKGNNIRNIGSELKKGALLFEKNKYIGAVEFGLMLSAGVNEVEVYQKPRIVVISSGEEVNWEMKQSNLESSRDRNGVMEAMIKDCGCQIVIREFIEDKPDILANKINVHVHNCDMMLLVGSVSRAIKDYKSIWRSTGSVLFSKGKPEKPVSFALYRDHKSGKDKVVFGLSGNPCNTIVAFHLFVQPVLKQMMSSSAVKHETFRVVLGEDVRLDPNQSLYEFVNFVKNTTGIVVAKLRRDPELSLQRAQAILHIPKASKVKSYLLEGTVVDVLPCGEIDPGLLSSILESNKVTSGEGHKNRNKSNSSNMPLSVGIITISDSSKPKVNAIISMVHQLFFCGNDCSMKFTNKNSPQLLQIMIDWTRGSNAKQLIFTVGGVGHKDKIHVSSVTQSLCKRELREVVKKMFEEYGDVNDVLSYRGTVGVCNKTLIVNLPEKEVVAKHCLKKLQDYVEAIIYAL